MSTSEVSRPPASHRRDLKSVARRTREEIKNHNVGLLAAGVAFYAFLSIFPAMTALVSIYALFANPADVQQQVQAVSGVLPKEALAIVQSQLQHITQSSGGALGFGAVIGILAALWSANKATSGLFQALTLVYGEKEKRSFLQLNGRSLLMTVGLLIASIVAIFLIAVFPVIVSAIGLGAGASTAAKLAPWPVLIGLVLLAFSALYRYAPDRQHPKWRWASAGALVATGLWLVASIGFAIYAQNFGSYNKTYGVLAAVVVLMLWLFISAYVVLIGGEVNSQLEQPTAKTKQLRDRDERSFVQLGNKQLPAH